MTKVTLNNVGSLIDATTAANTINVNSATVVTAFDNTLSRDGTQPNPMLSNLDMNSNRILNLPAPADAFDPVRLQDMTTFAGGGTITVNPLPTGGTTGQYLTKNSNANYDTAWSTPAPNLGIAKCWVVFTTATTPVLLSTYNVSSVTKVSTGVYTVLYPTQLFTDSSGGFTGNYPVFLTVENTGTAAVTFIPTGGRSTSQCTVICTNLAGTVYDPDRITFIAFGNTV